MCIVQAYVMFTKFKVLLAKLNLMGRINAVIPNTNRVKWSRVKMGCKQHKHTQTHAAPTYTSSCTVCRHIHVYIHTYTSHIFHAEIIVMSNRMRATVIWSLKASLEPL